MPLSRARNVNSVSFPRSNAKPEEVFALPAGHRSLWVECCQHCPELGDERIPPKRILRCPLAWEAQKDGSVNPPSLIGGIGGLNTCSGILAAQACQFSKPVHLNAEFTEAGALPCTDRAFLTEVQAFGVSFEREAGSPVCWKQ
jgi:hypothetical protein